MQQLDFLARGGSNAFLKKMRIASTPLPYGIGFLYRGGGCEHFCEINIFINKQEKGGLAMSKIRTKEEKYKKELQALQAQRDALDAQEKQVKQRKKDLAEARRKQENHQTFKLGGIVRKAGLGGVSHDELLGALLLYRQSAGVGEKGKELVDRAKQAGQELIECDLQTVPCACVFKHTDAPDRSDQARLRNAGLRRDHKAGEWAWSGSAVREKITKLAEDLNANLIFYEK